MTDLDTGPSSIRDDSICESSLNPNKSSGDIVERLRRHVSDRGGQFKDDDGNIVIPNGAWQMMVAAAAEIQRLRREVAICRDIIVNPDPNSEPDVIRLHREKCDALDRALTAESSVAAAMEVLKPFAYASECFGEGAPDDFDIWDSGAATMITVGDLRRASAIRAAGAEKTADSGHSPSTHNSASE